MSSISSTETEPTLSHSHTATIALEVIAWMVAMPVAIVYERLAIYNETPVMDVAGCLALLYIVFSLAKLGKQVLHRLT